MNNKKMDKFANMTKKIDSYLEKIQENLLNLNTLTNYDITEFNESKKPFKIANKLSKKISKWKKSVPEVKIFNKIETACSALSSDYRMLSNFYKNLKKSSYMTYAESNKLANLTISLYNAYNKLSTEISSYLANKNLKTIENEITSKSQILNTAMTAYEQLTEKSKEVSKKREQSTDIYSRENYEKQLKDLRAKIVETEIAIKTDKTYIANLNFKKQVLSAIVNITPAKADLVEEKPINQEKTQPAVKEQSEKQEETKVIKETQEQITTSQQTDSNLNEENVDKLSNNVDNLTKIVDKSTNSVDNSNKKSQNQGLKLNQLVKESTQDDDRQL